MKKQPVGVEIFDKIADKYDSISGFLSLGIIKNWQKRLSSIVKKKGVVLDLACGTGDVAGLVEKNSLFVVGLDYSLKMLKVAKKKYPTIPFVRGDALKLPFPNNCFDYVLVSLALRHFEKNRETLEEILRVLKPGGVTGILEVSIPRNPLLGKLFTGFLKHVLLPVGRLRSKEDVTQHLYETIVNFPHYEDFINLARDVGFKGGSFRPLMGGMATIYELKA